jgi:hypothetical protein
MILTYTHPLEGLQLQQNYDDNAIRGELMKLKRIDETGNYCRTVAHSNYVKYQFTFDATTYHTPEIKTLTARQLEIV